ncbi:hypothetical protein GJ496_006018 [Pomphorhynchus laevis]|nr:hypothetical protein GJ496_009790 [Pomphorhynchus laevis]KAI0987167.1 hypothetical protein GJ496_002543 [Pomphorhynchus laevis]KAI0990491.1 hypothetical protein GJ496_006018 [Pomphorhynchus laevis]
MASIASFRPRLNSRILYSKYKINRKSPVIARYFPTCNLSIRTGELGWAVERSDTPLELCGFSSSGTASVIRSTSVRTVMGTGLCTINREASDERHCPCAVMAIFVRLVDSFMSIQNALPYG